MNMLSISKLIAHHSLRPTLKFAPRQAFSTFRTLYATFTMRDLTDNSQGEAGTLINRFVKHIALEKCKSDPLVPQKIKYSDFYPLTNVSSFENYARNMPTDQIPRLIIFTYTFKTNGDLQKVAHVLGVIDALCMKRIDEMDHNTMLSILYSFMYLMPNKITKFDFYQRSIHRLVTEMPEDCSKEQFVEVCFYLGLWKKHRRSIDLMRHIRDTHLDRNVEQLSQMQFTIVANSLFKSSTVCHSHVFKNRLVDEVLQCDGSDDSILVTLVKSLRLNRVKSDAVLDKILDLQRAGKLDRMQFKGLAHIFALFADRLYNNSDMCSFFVTLCLKKLEETTNDEIFVFNDMRAKDFSTFIWACATLRCGHLLADHFDFLIEIVQEKIRRDEYKYCPDELIDTALSFWILGHKSPELIQEVLDIRFSSTNDSSDRVKLDSRLDLLKSCIAIETPKWMPRSKQNQRQFFEEERAAPKYLVERNARLQNVYNSIEQSKDEMEVKSIKYVAPINQLNIASILLETNDGNKCFVEVLDDDQILRFHDKHVALVDLKLRLLKHLGCSVIVVDPTTSIDDVLSTLKDSLNRTQKEVKEVIM